MHNVGWCSNKLVQSARSASTNANESLKGVSPHLYYLQGPLSQPQQHHANQSMPSASVIAHSHPHLSALPASVSIPTPDYASPTQAQ